jgi:hypothetical protein
VPLWPVLCALVACLVLPARASAQNILIQPFAAISFGGDTNIVDLDQAAKLRKLTWGGTVTFIGRGPLGVEGDFAYIPGFFERDTEAELVTQSRVVTLSGNVVIATPLSWTGDSLRPFFSGGIGLMRAQIDDLLDIFNNQRDLLGINLGGGAYGFFSERVGVRWDIRYFRSINDLDSENPVAIDEGPGKLSFWRVDMALVLRY